MSVSSVPPEAVRELALFAGVTRAEACELAPLLSRRRVSARARISLRLAMPDEVAFVSAGRFRIAAMARGGLATLFSLRVGDAIGHTLAVLRELSPEMIRLVADQDGELLVIKGGEFRAAIDRMPSVNVAVREAMARASKALADKVVGLIGLSARARVISTLLRLTPDGVVQDGRLVVAAAPTHAMLAEEVGVSREFVTRCLSELEVSGFISTRTRTIEFLDVEGLRALEKAEGGARIIGSD